jgi:energy-coupling factor transporter ATP-binding protein EcfA2
MKLFLATLLLASVANADQLETCTTCLEDIDDATLCLRECSNKEYNGNSLLAECLTDDNDLDDVTSIGDLVDCCQFERDCDNTLRDVQECLTGCLDTCIKDDAAQYLTCMKENTGSGGCELSKCLDSFLSEDTEDQITSTGSSDIFDLRGISDAVATISEDDVADCELLKNFVETTCDIGRSCCDRCDSELGAVVGCLINDIVIPFVIIESNTTIDKCPINEETCKFGSRRTTKELTAQEAELFNKAIKLPNGASSKRDPRKEGMVAYANERRLAGATIDEEVAACEQKMTMDIISANMTHASNKYMECITLSAIVSLEDDTEGSAASAAAKFVALAFSFGAALFF